MDFKEEWLRYCNLNETAEDIWLRDLVVSLIETPQPDEEQERLLHMADLYLTLKDLPEGAYPDHMRKFRELASQYTARRTKV